MAPSHSRFVKKLPAGTVPHGMAQIRSSVGHLTLHEHSAPAAAAAETTTAKAASSFNAKRANQGPGAAER